jgi:hypothetical protein
VNYTAYGYKDIKFSATNKYGTTTAGIAIYIASSDRPIATTPLDSIDTSAVDNFVNQFDVVPGEMPNIVSVIMSMYDPLDDALAVPEGILACNDDISLTGIMVDRIAGQQKHIAIEKCLVHGITGDHHHTEQQHIHQHESNKNIDHIEITKQALLSVLRRRRLFPVSEFREKVHTRTCFLLQ